MAYDIRDAMNIFPDYVKRAILNANHFIGALERRDIITYQDKIRLLSQLYHTEILFEQAGNDRIGELIDRNEPLMIARLGATELLCLHHFLEKRGNKNMAYNKRIRHSMSNNAGYFPVSDYSLDAFSKLVLDLLNKADAMAVWFNHYEDVICSRYCKDAELIDLTCLEPFHFTNPWSSKLAGRKVLVVHPFADSIRKQYQEKRHLLFASPDVLPEFELKTVKAVQSIAGTRVDFATWFDAYHHMCDEIKNIDFDICLVGAGAYGLPLAAFAKTLGKQAIHMGGVTQILFGIKGKRWEELYADTTAQLFNEHWVRPLESETPERKKRVENGCYW